MLRILQLPMTKEILGKMTAEERSLFLLLGYASNQVNALPRSTSPGLTVSYKALGPGRAYCCMWLRNCS
jgi:hypothetical protein